MMLRIFVKRLFSLTAMILITKLIIIIHFLITIYFMDLHLIQVLFSLLTKNLMWKNLSLQAINIIVLLGIKMIPTMIMKISRKQNMLLAIIKGLFKMTQLEKLLCILHVHRKNQRELEKTLDVYVIEIQYYVEDFSWLYIIK